MARGLRRRVGVLSTYLPAGSWNAAFIVVYKFSIGVETWCAYAPERTGTSQDPAPLLYLEDFQCGLHIRFLCHSCILHFLFNYSFLSIHDINTLLRGLALDATALQVVHRIAHWWNSQIVQCLDARSLAVVEAQGVGAG